MLAYILFAADNAREQELLASPEIGRFVYEHCKALIAGVEGLACGGIIARHQYPFLADADPAEFFVANFGQRCWAGRERLRPLSGPQPQWRIMLRPLQGRLSLARVRQFCARLRQPEQGQHNGQRHSAVHAVSLAPFNALSHPAWNTIATEDHRRDGRVIRIPSPGVFELRKDSLFADCEDPALCGRLSGSQQLQDLYFDDGALWAFHSGWEPGEADAPPPRPVPTARDAYLEGLPVFFRLPLFEMSPAFSLDCASLARLVARCGQEQEPSA